MPGCPRVSPTSSMCYGNASVKKQHVNSNQMPLSRRFALAKRLIDIAGASLLLLLTSPLLLVIALAIKATSRGPVFFRQER